MDSARQLRRRGDVTHDHGVRHTGFARHRDGRLRGKSYDSKLNSDDHEHDRADDQSVRTTCSDDSGTGPNDASAVPASDITAAAITAGATTAAAADSDATAAATERVRDGVPRRHDVRSVVGAAALAEQV